jgi:serine/threonine protein kinase
VVRGTDLNFAFLTLLLTLIGVQGLSHLQNLGVCHRDLSLENIVVDTYTKSVVIDLGMCLRVPYHDDATGGVTDVTKGSVRRLMNPSGSCGKIWYMSPEILKNEEKFDGFAIDLWGAGIILFIMLVGRPPWSLASHQDPGYRMVAVEGSAHGPVERLDQTGVGRLVLCMGREISPLAADLLQKMLIEDPRQRLSLLEVKDHAWLEDEAEAEEMADPDDEWRD